MRLPKATKELLEKARDSATQAISTYNDPRSAFRTGNFTVLMSIAWTALLHAYFEKEKVRYFYKKNPHRYIYVDGEKKAWELQKCVSEVFDENDPVRKNIELFIRLRNKIEHRNLPGLDPELVGECQAFVINFEDWISQTFGTEYSLLETVFVPIQLMSSRRAIPKSTTEGNVLRFIQEYRNILEPDVINSQQFTFKAYLVPKIGNHRSSSDVAIEFVKYDESNPSEMEQYDRAIVAIKEKTVHIANLNHYKPTQVIEKLADKGFEKKIHWHTTMWKKYKVRPHGKSKNKSNCKTEYCVYDSAHSDYLYTDAWVSLLEKELLE